MRREQVGFQHGEAINHCGGIAVIADLNIADAENVAKKIGAAKAKLLFEFFKNDEGSLK